MIFEISLVFKLYQGLCHLTKGSEPGSELEGQGSAAPGRQPSAVIPIRTAVSLRDAYSLGEGKGIV